MITRDLFGNNLSEGDTVSFALSAGNFILGKVEKIHSGLDGSQPVMVININVPLPIHPNGAVQGVFHVKVEQESKLV